MWCKLKQKSKERKRRFIDLKEGGANDQFTRGNEGRISIWIRHTLNEKGAQFFRLLLKKETHKISREILKKEKSDKRNSRTLWLCQSYVIKMLHRLLSGKSMQRLLCLALFGSRIWIIKFRREPLQMECLTKWKKNW